MESCHRIGGLAAAAGAHKIVGAEGNQSSFQAGRHGRSAHPARIVQLRDEVSGHSIARLRHIGQPFTKPGDG